MVRIMIEHRIIHLVGLFTFLASKPIERSDPQLISLLRIEGHIDRTPDDKFLLLPTFGALE
jgi:hypothetical protein